MMIFAWMRAFAKSSNSHNYRNQTKWEYITAYGVLLHYMIRN